MGPPIDPAAGMDPGAMPPGDMGPPIDPAAGMDPGAMPPGDMPPPGGDPSIWSRRWTSSRRYAST